MRRFRDGVGSRVHGGEFLWQFQPVPDPRECSRPGASIVGMAAKTKKEEVGIEMLTIGRCVRWLSTKTSMSRTLRVVIKMKAS